LQEPILYRPLGMFFRGSAAMRMRTYSKRSLAGRVGCRLCSGSISIGIAIAVTSRRRPLMASRLSVLIARNASRMQLARDQLRGTNMSGFVARACQDMTSQSPDAISGSLESGPWRGP
jgi:hypothetical protein